MREPSGALSVVHVVSAMRSGDGELWGKERVVAMLMRAQRESGDVVPRLLTFGPCALGEVLSAQGFRVQALDLFDETIPVRALLALRRNLAREAPSIVHTHGYKANIVARLARATGCPMRGLISTCHGWVDETTRTRLYNRIDRASAPLSDVVTVTDSGMLSYIPKRAHPQYVANGIDERAPITRAERLAARAKFGFAADRFVVGTLGRVESAKGILDVLEAARRTAGLPIQWAIAGSGPLERKIRESGLPNVTSLGYVAESHRFLDAIDVYLQASHAEGLSLSLLEAMRSGLPIVATQVGSTEQAVRSMSEAMLVPPKDIIGIVTAVRRLMDDRDLAAELAAAARQRFETAFNVRRQHEAFLEIYASCDRMRA